MLIKKSFFVLLSIICCNNLFAQIIERQVIASSGNYADSINLKLSSTIGETVVPTFSQSTLIVTQGFQQCDTFCILTSVGISYDKDYIIKVYPSPATTEVIVDFRAGISADIGIEVYNEAGQLLLEKTNITNKLHLNFSRFAAGNYLIVSRSSDIKLCRNFTVQKLN